MKTIATASALVALVALGSLSMGCSASPSTGKGGGGNVNTGTAISGLRSPTGTFSKASASSAFAGYRSKRADSQHVSAPVPNGGGAGGGASTASIRTVRLLDQATSGGACAQGQDCACPTGGTMAYESEQTSDGQLVSVRFDACGFEDGTKFDGDAIVLASTKSLLGAASDAPAKEASPPASGDGSGLKEASDPGAGASGGIVALLLAAQGTATVGGQTEAIEFALLTEEHYAFLAVSVPDGSLVIGVGEDGNAVIHAKDATWKCKNASAGWSCTSESGESLEVADDGGAASGEGSSPAPAPAPGGSGANGGA
ncbi:MAG TPA: hypothetical protein VLT33_47455 [Labilithrix sp.]|nr:hypothetical protein [Labilithrix sp.]